MSLVQVARSSSIIFLILSFGMSSLLIAEENPAETCINASNLFKEGDVEGALEEARWCVTQLEQLKQGETAAFFKDEMNGFKAGKLNEQQAMGMSMVDRSYSKGGKSIKVALAGGASGTANNAFAALASLGMQATQGKKIRIQRRSATLTNENGKNKVSVTLKSGGVLTFESKDFNSDEVVRFAKAFPVADLDDSRK